MSENALPTIFLQGNVAYNFLDVLEYIKMSNVEIVKGAENLEAIIKDGLSIVDFWATWCKPCKDIAPKFEALSGVHGGEMGVKFLKCDIADFEEDDLVDMGLEKIPAFFVYKNGEKVEEFLGNECGEALEKYLNGLTKAGGGAGDEGETERKGEEA